MSEQHTFLLGATDVSSLLPSASNVTAALWPWWENLTLSWTGLVDTVGWPAVVVFGVVGLGVLLLLDRFVHVGGIGADTVPGKQNLALAFVKMLWQFRAHNLVDYVREHKELYAEAKRTGDHAAVTAHFYDLMGGFIAYYYGPCFHFAPPDKLGQTRSEAILSLHQRIARVLGLHAGSTVLDIGCGLGAMIHDISPFTGASMTGLAISTEEVKEGNDWLARDGLDYHCKIVQGDAQAMPFAANEFDAAYAVYSLKYFSKLDRVLGHVQRTLKPGGLFLVYCIIKTDSYDETNPVHRKVVGDFEYSCGMPSLHTRQAMIDAADKAGLECVTKMDLSRDIPWYYEFDIPALHFCLTNPISLSAVNLLETLHLLPQGFRAWLDIFVTGNVMGIYRAGKMKILSGSDILVFRKPLQKK